MDQVLILLIHIIVFLSRFSRPLSGMGIGTYFEWSQGKPIELLLVGYNGARNTGADARVAAIVKQLKSLFGAQSVHMTVMTLNEQNLAGYFDEDVTLLPFSSIFLWDLYRACCRSYAAILCEDSTLDERLENLLRELSFAQDYLYSVTDPELGEKLYSSMETAWERSPGIAAQIHFKYTEYMERLSEMGRFLKTYIIGRLS